jgi:hypothetical protein
MALVSNNTSTERWSRAAADCFRWSARASSGSWSTAAPLMKSIQLAATTAALVVVCLLAAEAAVSAQTPAPQTFKVAFYNIQTFDADASKPYRLWIRAVAQNNHYYNDSVYAQFDRSTDAAGNPVNRIGTTSATNIVLEDCGGCAMQGWGWQDNGYAMLGPLVYFATSGPQRLRIQVREDGIGIDQVVLSAVKYKTQPPGATKNDATILPASGQ